MRREGLSSPATSKTRVSTVWCRASSRRSSQSSTSCRRRRSASTGYADRRRHELEFFDAGRAVCTTSGSTLPRGGERARSSTTDLLEIFSFGLIRRRAVVTRRCRAPCAGSTTAIPEIPDGKTTRPAGTAARRRPAEVAAVGSRVAASSTATAQVDVAGLFAARPWRFTASPPTTAHRRPAARRAAAAARRAASLATGSHLAPPRGRTLQSGELATSQPPPVLAPAPASRAAAPRPISDEPSPGEAPGGLDLHPARTSRPGVSSPIAYPPVL